MKYSDLLDTLTPDTVIQLFNVDHPKILTKEDVNNYSNPNAEVLSMYAIDSRVIVVIVRDPE